MNKIGTKIIDTERCILRRIVPDDYQMMYENWAKYEEVCRYFPFNPVTDMEIYKEKVHKWADNYESDTYFHWVIEWKENHDLIGTINLGNVEESCFMSDTCYSSSIYDMYDKAISSYKNAPAGTREDIKKKYQNNKLNLQGSIQNAIAHNDVVYDTRFKKMDPSRPMKQCLILEMGDAVHKFQDYR